MKHFNVPKDPHSPLFALTVGSFAVAVFLFLFIFETVHYSSLSRHLTNQNQKLERENNSTIATLKKLQSEDQYVINQKNIKEIQHIKETYKKAVTTYERLLDLKSLSNKTAKFDKEFADILTFLSDSNYGSAESALTTLNNDLDKERSNVASTFVIPANVETSNTPPTSGHKKMQVSTPNGNFLVDIIAADLNSTKVVVDTASSGDCANNCPVLALGDYIARSGAYAGINGPYFCPESYPSCAGKTNSFDTLLMNKNKTYFNSANNVYSVVPVGIFSNTTRFLSRSLDWGRDTGPDAVIAAQPMLLLNGSITYGGDDEVKRAGKGTRSFIGGTGNTVYIGVVYNANVAEVAVVLHSLGVSNALNLDSGGSIALWNGGYIAGPGRNTPFGILFVKR